MKKDTGCCYRCSAVVVGASPREKETDGSRMRPECSVYLFGNGKKENKGSLNRRKKKFPFPPDWENVFTNHLSFLSSRLRGHITYANRLFINPPLLPLFFSTLKGSLNYSYLPPGVELEGKGEKSASLGKKSLESLFAFLFLSLPRTTRKTFFLGWWWAKRGGKVRWALSSFRSLAGCVCQRGFLSLLDLQSSLFFFVLPFFSSFAAVSSSGLLFPPPPSPEPATGVCCWWLWRPL